MKWEKYQGCGNDFFIAEKIDENQALSKEFCKAFCDRHFGFGADGVILLTRVPLTMEIYNADGSVAAMCGNGLRCSLNFAYDQGWIRLHEEIKIKTGDGTKIAVLLSDTPFEAKVNMGKPDFDAKRITSHVDINPNLVFPPSLCSTQACSFWMGVPHTVVFTQQLQRWTTDIARGIEKDSFFVWGSNINFVKIDDEHTCHMKTWERGIGWTLACGTGACATAIAGVLFHQLTMPVILHCPGGTLSVDGNIEEGLWLLGSCQRIGSCQWDEK